MYLTFLDVELVRVMPNTPALIGKGITGAYVNSPDAKQVIDVFSLLFADLNLTLYLNWIGFI